jgi:hypothetical protein
MKRESTLLQLVPGIVFAGVVLIPIYLIIAPIAGLWPYDPCITEIREKISNRSGFDFETTRTDCDAIAKSAWVSVFVSVSGDREKTLLFKYDPVVDEMPVISVANPAHITISIPRVAQLFFQKHDWRGVDIEYQIGHVGSYAKP